MKTKRNIEPNCRVEVSLNDVVDKDVQKMLFPLHLMQNIMFCPKYSVKGNYVTPLSHVSTFIGFFGTIFFVGLFMGRIYLDKYNSSYTGYIYFTSCYDATHYCIGFIMNFTIGIVYTKKYITFILTIQSVHRILNDESCFKKIIIWNWITVLIACGFYIILFTYFAVQQNLPFISFLCCYILVNFDLNVVYAIRFLKLLEQKVVLWNMKAFNYNGTEETQREEDCKKLFQLFVDIMKCYDIYKRCYQWLIFYYIAELFTHSLIYIQVALEVFKNNLVINDIKSSSSLTMISVSCWLSKNLLWQLYVSLRCEKFYIAVQNVQDSCALMLQSNCSDDEKKLFKNVQRFHRASFSKISACGLFYVDAALQLSLMCLLTDYIIVLLQFAFL